MCRILPVLGSKDIVAISVLLIVGTDLLRGCFSFPFPSSLSIISLVLEVSVFLFCVGVYDWLSWDLPALRVVSIYSRSWLPIVEATG